MSLNLNWLGKVNKEPAPKDAPNAPMPGVGLPEGHGEPQDQMRHVPGGRATFHSEAHKSMSLHTPWGMISSDADGKCQISAAHKEGAAHLVERGFHKCRKVGCVKDDAAMDAIKNVLHTGALKGRLMDVARNADRSGGLAASLSADPMKWLHSRAAKAAGETPAESRYVPRDAYIESLRALGWSLAEATRIANGQEA